MAYTKTEWKARKGTGLSKFNKFNESNISVTLENAPGQVTEQGTPFSPANMNHIEQGIEDAHGLIADEEQARQQADNTLASQVAAETHARAAAINSHDASPAAHADMRAILNNLIGLPQWDSNNHIITFTAKNGATMEIDLPLESLAQDVGYDAGTKEIVITKQGGAQIRVSVSDLIDVYAGSTGTGIQVTVANNVISAKLLAGAVGETELASALLAKINGKLDASQKGIAGGVAELDGTGKVPLSQLPTSTGGGGGGTKPATLIIGTDMAGHAAGEVDILCTGTNDHVTINSAIAALTEGGGKIVIREGTYNLGSTGSINVDKDNVTIEGMGPSTILNATAAITSATTGLIKITGNHCKIANLKITNPSNGNVRNGIYITGENNKIEGNNIANNSTGSGGIGILINGVGNKIESNNIANTFTGSNSTSGIGILISSINNKIEGNNIANSGTGSSSNAFITTIGLSFEGGQHNIAAGNNIANSSTGSGGNCYGIVINNSTFITVKDNKIANRKPSGSGGQANTFALRVAATNTDYCTVLSNNLVDAGGIYTTNGTVSAALPGSATTIEPLNNGGSCGFNIP